MRLFTVGYEGASLDEFLARLREAGVRQVADVREAPVSRKKGFAKSALSAALEGADIGYMHLRALGCPKPIRDRHKEDGDWDTYTRGFMAHLARQGDALKLLADESQKSPTAVLCYEADFNRCHRTYVARAAAQMTGVEVMHLTRNGVVDDAPFSAVPQ